MPSPSRHQHPRDLLEFCFREGVRAVSPDVALRGVLRAPPSSAATPWILGIGKAAAGMVAVAGEVLTGAGHGSAEGLAVLDEPPGRELPVLWCVGDHPVPRAASLHAAEQLRETVARIPAGHPVWVFLSGGASSLIAAPIGPITPEDLRELWRVLLSSGLPIGEMNAIRKLVLEHAGGRLGVALGGGGRAVSQYLISDVPGDDIADIGSGPCVGTVDHREMVRAHLASLPLSPALRDRILTVLEASPPPRADDPALAGITHRIVATNRHAREAVGAAARTLGWEVEVEGTPVTGEARLVGREFAAFLVAQEPGSVPRLIVRGGETTVKLPSTGTCPPGGRNQELALAAAEVLSGDRMNQPVVLAAGTDGRDGTTEAAGAVVDGETWERIRTLGIDPERALTDHRAHEALAAVDALVITGRTGTNVMDLLLGVVPPRGGW